MPDSIDSKRLTHTQKARHAALIAIGCGILLAGCGGSSGAPATAVAARSTGAATTDGGASSARSTTGGGATGSRPASPAAPVSAGLAFSRCMRANGVPNFPDPTPGRGLEFSTNGFDPSAPAVVAAHAKCQKLLPNGGPPSPGTKTNPSAQTLTRLLNIARCMRAHGISQFPDPGTSVPDNFGPGIDRGLTDFDGAILVWPLSLNMESPAYVRAAAACGSLAQKLGMAHPH